MGYSGGWTAGVLGRIVAWVHELGRAYAGALAMAAAVAAQSGCSGQRTPRATAACRVTIPNGSTPPGERPSAGFHGNGQLWTGLPPRGELIYSGGGQFTAGRYVPSGQVGLHADGSATDKFAWWGARSAGRDLSITGQRLDRPAPSLRAHVGTGFTQAPHFWPSYVTFPTSGCWRVTARSGRVTLTFQVSVSIPAVVHH
jgi:hypothetical protein